MSIIHVVGAAIIEDGRIMSARRGPDMAAAGKWEFPGGKIEPDEDPATALERELKEELHIQTQTSEFVARGESNLPDGRVIWLDVYISRILEGEPQLTEHDALRWLMPDELESLDWAEPDWPAVHALVERFGKKA